jgi:mono/diheme cytochrome c family protein
LAGAALTASGVFLWSGVYDIGADDPHWRPTYALLELVRDRSIDARTQHLVVPTDLSSPARISRGAGNYAAMCAVCHLAPGVESSELSLGLYPAPPNLSRTSVAPARAFWVIKHGIKASGMAAWGRHMGDDDIWSVVALLQQLPRLDDPAYDALVGASGGHVHEPGSHRHEHGAEEAHHH